MIRKQQILQFAIVAAMLNACGGINRFPLAEPRWEDADRNHVPKEPGKFYSGLMADGADKLFFYQLQRAAYIPVGERARNVNSMDEVPNSSWWQNRVGFYKITPKQAARAACGNTPPIDPNVPWTVVAAKPDGANPGFFIKAGKSRYLLKFDGFVTPPRATAADVIGSKLYWLVGYHSPCNEIVYFRRENLKIGKGAKTEDRFGSDRPMTKKDVDKVLAAAFRFKNGLLRASASRFLPGKPLGPFRYDDTRSDDPNDHIPHQHRRELRANKILSAWINHHDAREQNTLDLLVKEGDRSYIRHYMIDWGDTMGGRWEWDPLSRRTGNSYFMDWAQLPIDYLTLGIYPRAWKRAKFNQVSEIFSYFRVEDFVAADWKTDYPNAAFMESRYDDELWMARIMARITDEHIRAIVKEGRIPNKRAEEYLIKTLIGRRDATFKQYFTKYAPLDRFRLVRRKKGSPIQSLCFEDLAVKTGVVSPLNVTYKIRFYGGKKLDKQLGWLQYQPDQEHPQRSCIQLPLGDTRPANLAKPGAPDDDPLRYGMMNILVYQRLNLRPTSSIQVFFYDLGPKRGFRIVGIERPKKPLLPVRL